MQEITQRTLKDTMYYRNIPVLIYQINYPSFVTSCSRAAAQSINKYYETSARRIEQYGRTILYYQAVDSAGYIPNNNPPFNSYKLNVNYKTTFNIGCITSLYTDSYVYMGGAHEETRRQSDTWNFSNGSRLYLSDVYPLSPDTLSNLKAHIGQQISNLLRLTPGSFFEDYKALIGKSFDSNHFYLLPESFVIYFQPYELAPYTTGIPEFVFPYQAK